MDVSNFRRIYRDFERAKIKKRFFPSPLLNTKGLNHLARNFHWMFLSRVFSSLWISLLFSRFGKPAPSPSSPRPSLDSPAGKWAIVTCPKETAFVIVPRISLPKKRKRRMVVSLRVFYAGKCIMPGCSTGELKKTQIVFHAHIENFALAWYEYPFLLQFFKFSTCKKLNKGFTVQ